MYVFPWLRILEDEKSSIVISPINGAKEEVEAFCMSASTKKLHPLQIRVTLAAELSIMPSGFLITTRNGRYGSSGGAGRSSVPLSTRVSRER